jgi:hypothetical protein
VIVIGTVFTAEHMRHVNGLGFGLALLIEPVMLMSDVTFISKVDEQEGHFIFCVIMCFI